MRIFLGLNEIGNIIAAYASGFEYLGYDTLTCILHKKPFFDDWHYDVILNPEARKDYKSYFRMIILFLRSVFTCDLFIFTYSSLLPGFADLPLLKILGKRIIFVFLGSEVRSIDAFESHMRSLGLEREYRPFIDGVRAAGEQPVIKKIRLVKAAEKYADLIYSQAGFAQLQTRPYSRVIAPLNLSLYHFHVPGRKVPLILHAPTNQVIKGTDIILKAVDDLKREGIDFEFRLVQDMPNPELRRLLSDADIVVDELYADSLGVFSSEGMATGNAVLVHYPEYAGVPQPCPAINITEDNLRDHLRKAILDIPWRTELATKGREYVEKHNDNIKIARALIEAVFRNA